MYTHIHIYTYVYNDNNDNSDDTDNNNSGGRRGARPLAGGGLQAAELAARRLELRGQQLYMCVCVYIYI